MIRIRVNLESEREQFVVHFEPELLAKDNPNAVALSYDEAMQLYSRLGELIEKYEDKEDKLGSLDRNTA